MKQRKRPVIIDGRLHLTWQAGSTVADRRVRWWSPVDVGWLVVAREGWLLLVYHALRRWDARAEERDRRRGRWPR